MSTRTVAITGASGFIGGHLVPLLLKKHYALHVITRTRKEVYGNSVTYHTSPSHDEWVQIAETCDAIIHLAGTIDINSSLESPRTRIEDNVDQLFPILEAARTAKQKPLIVFASTDRVYGHTRDRIASETTPTAPIEPYTASKLIGEMLLSMYQQLYGVPYITLRLDSVYGPGQPRTMFISDVIQKMLRQNHIETGPLSTKKNFVYVEDVADAFIKALTSSKSAQNQVYNIGDAPRSLKELLRSIQAIISKRRGVAITTSERHTPYRPSIIEVRPFVLSLAKAKRLLKWHPRTPLYTGLNKTVEYFNTYENQS